MRRPSSGLLVLLLTAAAAAVSPSALAHGSSAKPNATNGKLIFKLYCGKCHTVKAAGTVAKGRAPGPSLGTFKVTAAKVIRILNVGGSDMSSFVGILTPSQIADVAAFVSAPTTAK